MGIFSKKNKQQQQVAETNFSYNRRESAVDFSKYDKVWNQEMNQLAAKEGQLRRAGLSNEGTAYGNDFTPFQFEKAARKQEQSKVNDFNFNENSDLFYDNVKAQIFLETQRLLGGSTNIDQSLERRILEEKYKTGDDYEDNLIRIASNDDPTLLQLLNDRFERNKNNPYARGKDINSLTRQDQLFDSSRQVYNATAVDEIRSDWISELSDSDKNKIRSYSSYNGSQPKVPVNNQKENRHEPAPTIPVNKTEIPSNQNKYDREWLKYRQDIIDYTESRNYKQPSEPIINNTPTQPTSSKPITTFRAEPEIIENAPVMDDSFLVKTDDVARPSLKPVAPIIDANDRVKNVKDINDTEWEKIKGYIKDFNTNEDSVAIGNTSTIVDADDALKVDLNAKFYLTPEQLKLSREKQLSQFQSVIDDYEQTIKLHEKQELQKAYDEINKTNIDNTIKENKLKQKIDDQNKENLKVIDENLKLKKQIKELEQKLAKIPETPVAKPIDTKSLDSKTMTIYPNVAEAIEAQKKLAAKEKEDKLQNNANTHDNKPSQIDSSKTDNDNSNNVNNNFGNETTNVIHTTNHIHHHHHHTTIINESNHPEHEDESALLREELETNTNKPKPNIKLIKPKSAYSNQPAMSINNRQNQQSPFATPNANKLDGDEISATIIAPVSNTNIENNPNKNKFSNLYANTLAKSRDAAVGSASNSYAPYNDMIRTNDRLQLSQYRNSNGMPISPSSDKTNKIVSIKQAYGK